MRVKGTCDSHSSKRPSLGLVLRTFCLHPSFMRSGRRSRCPPLPPTFYVSPTGLDSNPGTENAPWKTIGKAAAVLVGGETAIIMDGIYEEPEVIFSHSGSQTQPITIRAQNPRQAILSSTSGCNPAISVDASYITIDGLRFSVSNNNVTCGIYTSANVAVRCWEATVPDASSPSTGNVGCTLRNVLIDYSPARALGVKSNQDMTLIENSEIHSGFEAFNNFGTIVRNNTVYTLTNDTPGDGNGIWGKGGVRNFQIYNNTVYVSPGDIGIHIGGNTGCCWFDETTHIEAYNGVVYNNVVIALSGANEYLMGLTGANDSALYNNVVIGGRLFFARGGDLKNGIPPNTYPANPVVKNNIFNCRGGTAASLDGYTGSLDLDYNNFFNCSSNVPTQDHPVIGDPLFVNDVSVPYDWHLHPGSPALGAGVTLAPFPSFIVGESIDVSKNRDGLVRTIPWNLGIY